MPEQDNDVQFFVRYDMTKCIGNLITVLFLIFLGLIVGCNVTGLVMSESYHEKRIPAEFDLKKQAGKVLIFVEKPIAVTGEYDIETKIGSAIEALLVAKARLKKENLVIYGMDWKMGAEGGSFSQLSVPEIGKASGAEMVLYVRIEDYKLYEMGGFGYYGGLLVTRSVLYDVTSGVRLWPKGESERVVRVGFKLETDGRDRAYDRLISGVSHCITRSFYNCPRGKYKSNDEQDYKDSL